MKRGMGVNARSYVPQDQLYLWALVNPAQPTLVPQAIAAVKRDFPDILIKVEMDYSRPLVAKLLDGQLDIVVGRIMGPEGAGELDFEPLADEPHAVIVRAGHPLTRRPRITHADLADYGWIMPPAASVLRSRLDAVFLEHGQPPPQNIVETASLPVIIHLLRHSDLLTALPAESVGPYLQTGQMCVLPIELGVRMEFFGIIRRRDQLLSPGAERVLDHLQLAVEGDLAQLPGIAQVLALDVLHVVVQRLVGAHAMGLRVSALQQRRKRAAVFTQQAKHLLLQGGRVRTQVGQFGGHGNHRVQRRAPGREKRLSGDAVDGGRRCHGHRCQTHPGPAGACRSPASSPGHQTAG